jgi:pantoate--beta-alanine ligase
MPTRITETPTRITTPEALRRWSLRCHAAGMSVGLVPTMGALHGGHRSLIDRARADCDRVVVSIFVNPTQFGPDEDFDRYPRTLEADLVMLVDAGVDAVYLPSVAVMYPPGAGTRVHVEGPLAEVLEAASRPGHLDGVALVVTKLFTAARPDRAYFGRKDAQQCAVVQRLAADLDTGVTVVVCPTVRDHDGLALSSRNAYLNPEERARALAIPKGLAAAAALYDTGERDGVRLIDAVKRHLESVDARVDYVALVDPDTFVEVDFPSPGCEILVAARIGMVRLIDAMQLGFDEAPVVGGASGNECSGSF